MGIGALEQMTWRADDRPPARVRVRPVGVLGLALLLAGLVLAGYIGWQFVGTNVVSHHRQSQLREHVRKEWAAAGGSTDSAVGTGRTASNSHHRNAAGAPAAGQADPAGQTDQARRHAMLADAIALIRIPRFGADYEMPVVDGVSEDALASGVGWFDQTARPGQVGNFALAGHRITHGQPFSQFPDLRAGDKVVVETKDFIYTYVLDDSGTDLEVADTDGWVLDSVPGHPGAQPRQALITLTTCAELFHTDERSVVFGHLVDTERKD